MQQARDLKNGYSQKEVWQWLHLDDNEAKNSRLDCPPAQYDDEKLYCDKSAMNAEQSADGKAGVSVQFSPAEFLSATTRLAHLDLEGFERFVGSTFDRAIAGAKSGGRIKSSNLILAESEDKCDTRGEVVEGGDAVVENCQPDTDTYVWKDTCR